MSAANAAPITKTFAKGVSLSNGSSNGVSKEQVNTGKATLDIHIDKKNMTAIAIKITFLGFVPAVDNNQEASILAISYRDKASPPK